MSLLYPQEIGVIAHFPVIKAARTNQKLGAFDNRDETMKKKIGERKGKGNMGNCGILCGLHTCTVLSVLYVCTLHTPSIGGLL